MTVVTLNKKAQPAEAGWANTRTALRLLRVKGVHLGGLFVPSGRTSCLRPDAGKRQDSKPRACSWISCFAVKKIAHRRLPASASLGNLRLSLASGKERLDDFLPVDWFHALHRIE